MLNTFQHLYDQQRELARSQRSRQDPDYNSGYSIRGTGPSEIAP